MKWFTSDNHFGHKNIIKLCNRPFDDLESMHAAMLDEWSVSMKPGDVLYHLGDLFFHRLWAGSINYIPADMVLIMGNHDPKRKKYEDIGVPVLESATIRLGRHNVNLCHYPYAGDHTDEDRFKDKRMVDDGKWLIHGHVHDKWKVKGRMINVSVEMWDYKPVPETEILSIMQMGEVEE